MSFINIFIRRFFRNHLTPVFPSIQWWWWIILSHIPPDGDDFMRIQGGYAVSSYQALFIVRDVFIVIWLTDKIEISMNYPEGANQQKENSNIIEH